MAEQDDSDPRVMTAMEVSASLRINRATLYCLIKRAMIPCYKIASDYRFNREAIDDWRKRGGAR